MATGLAVGVAMIGVADVVICMVAVVGVVMSMITVVGVVTSTVVVATSIVAVDTGATGEGVMDTSLDTTVVDIRRVVLAKNEVAAVGMMVLVGEGRSMSKSITILPLEQKTNILSATVREGLVSVK